METVLRSAERRPTTVSIWTPWGSQSVPKDEAKADAVRRLLVALRDRSQKCSQERRGV